MKNFISYLILCVSTLFIFSGCSASIARRLELDLSAVPNDKKLSYEINHKELFVLFKVENKQIKIEDIRQFKPPEEKLKALFKTNQNNFKKPGKKGKFCDCLKFTDDEYQPCSNWYVPKGSLYSKRKFNPANTIGAVILSPIYALLFIFEPQKTINDFTDEITKKANDEEQIDLLGTHLKNLIIEEMEIAARNYDGLKSFLAKYPDSGFGSNPFILKKLSEFAANDYAGLNKANINEINRFINKYADIARSRCLSPTISSLTVRKGPGTKNAVAFTIGNKDTICSVTGKRNGWVQFSGSEIKSKYSGKYWVNEDYLHITDSPVKASKANRLPSLLSRAKKVRDRLRKMEQIRKKKLIAAKKAKKQKALAKKKAAIRKKKIARVQKQLNTALESNSMPELEKFITAHKNDSDVASMVKKANARYKELLFQ